MFAVPAFLLPGYPHALRRDDRATAAEIGKGAPEGGGEAEGAAPREGHGTTFLQHASGMAARCSGVGVVADVGSQIAHPFSNPATPHADSVPSYFVFLSCFTCCNSASVDALHPPQPPRQPIFLGHEAQITARRSASPSTTSAYPPRGILCTLAAAQRETRFSMDSPAGREAARASPVSG